ncbi:MAG TPA: PmoA family protein [Clostridia bacterium]|nr:PmoA family protein [Clostridia bacterium]
MQPHMQRRTFLKSSLASAALLPWALRAATPSKPASPTVATENLDGLSVYQLGPQIWIRSNNRPLTCYRAHRSQKYPYCYPLSGPISGLSLTDETTLPYPHHRSLFFGCDRVNGGNYWQEGLERGQILSSGPSVGANSKNSVEILDACDWQKPGGPVVMKDQRKLTISAPQPNLHILDWHIIWSAVENAVVLKTNHSLFSMRAALDITPKGGGALINAEGDSGEKGTFGKKSAWCGFFGKRAKMPDVIEGIAIMDHPKNPWAPTPWFTRDYGFASPTPLNFVNEKWELPAGESVTLRYRVVMHEGSPADAKLGALYTEWAAQNT